MTLIDDLRYELEELGRVCGVPKYEQGFFNEQITAMVNKYKPMLEMFEEADDEGSEAQRVVHIVDTSNFGGDNDEDKK